MGILNVTPDSFSDGGRFVDAEEAVEAGLRMRAEGADLIDVGGESTRPGSTPVDEEEEMGRVLEVVSGLARQGVPVSIDTMKAGVARACLDAGAVMVNDVSGLRDPEMKGLVQERASWVCIMHMQGNPQTMQQNPRYGDVVEEVRDYLLDQASGLGLPKERVCLDPGIGFGKTLEQNLALIRGLSQFVDTGYPIMIGVSRKSLIGKISSAGEEILPVGDRLEGTLAIQTLAQSAGVSIIRAHDVQASARAIRAASAIQNAF